MLLVTPSYFPLLNRPCTVVLIVLCASQGEKDDKVIAVHADDPEFKGFTDISQLPPHRLQEIRRSVTLAFRMVLGVCDMDLVCIPIF